MVDAAHFIGLVAGGAIPSPGAVRRRRHVHHPQGAARPARRHDRVPGRSWPPRIDKAVFPFLQGGPLMHAVAAKAVALRRVPAAGVPRRTRARSSPTRRRSPTALAAEGMRPVSGGTDTHLALLDLRELGVDRRRDAEERCDAARITLNKNAIPYDPQPPMVGVRHPGRHAGGHDAGHDRGRR